MKAVTKVVSQGLSEGQIVDLVSHRSGHVTVCFLLGQRQLSLVTGDSMGRDGRGDDGDKDEEGRVADMSYLQSRLVTNRNAKQLSS